MNKYNVFILYLYYIIINMLLYTGSTVLVTVYNKHMQYHIIQNNKNLITFRREKKGSSVAGFDLARI